jgi:hypothetical protein
MSLRVCLGCLVGRDTTNPHHPHRSEFSLPFAQLSPYAVAEMLDMSDAQEDRFRFAYDVTKAIMRDLGICPEKNKSKEEVDRQEKLLMRVDESLCTRADSFGYTCGTYSR